MLLTRRAPTRRFMQLLRRLARLARVCDGREKESSVGGDRARAEGRETNHEVPVPAWSKPLRIFQLDPLEVEMKRFERVVVVNDGQTDVGSEVVDGRRSRRVGSDAISQWCRRRRSNAVQMLVRLKGKLGEVVRGAFGTLHESRSSGGEERCPQCQPHGPTRGRVGKFFLTCGIGPSNLRPLERGGSWGVC